MTQRTRGLFRQ